MNTATARMAKPEIDYHTIKCGTATLGRQAEIELCIETPYSEPIYTKLTHRIIIGRADENACDVDINVASYDAAQKGVSRRHAALELVNKILVVSDLNSTNGTFINGQRIPRGNRRVVRDGDELLLGDLLIYVFYSGSHAKRETRQPE
jgi:pSer/pThr/pTyr-binding forkhead associated (FHA) protein